jgi:hypothetical protein
MKLTPLAKLSWSARNKQSICPRTWKISAPANILLIISAGANNLLIIKRAILLLRAYLSLVPPTQQKLRGFFVLLQLIDYQSFKVWCG